MVIEDINKQIKEKKKELKNVKGSDCEVYSRIVGYYRSIKNYNDGQRAQYKERKKYKIKEIKE